MPDKKYNYDKGTEKLVSQIKNLALPPDFIAEYDMSEMIYRFREAFKNPEIRNAVLNQVYEQDRLDGGRFSAGFCGIASYTWNQLFRMPDKTELWRLKMVSKETHNLANHVWLENAFTGEMLDLTFDQFVDKNGCYTVYPYYRFGNFANSDFIFKRAIDFAKGIGIEDLDRIVLKNAMRSFGRR